MKDILGKSIFVVSVLSPLSLETINATFNSKIGKVNPEWTKTICVAMSIINREDLSYPRSFSIILK